MYSINFVDYGVKKFQLNPKTVARFSLLSSGDADAPEGLLDADYDQRSTIVCDAKDFSDWIDMFQILNRYGSSFDKELFDVAFNSVSANLGLRGKFVLDRFKEKGWKPYV